MNSTTLRVSDIIDQSPVSALQIRVLLLCFLVVVLDGFDTAAIGYIAPELIRDWGIERSQLAPAFAAGLFGMLLGNTAMGPFADRYGRKSALLVSLSIVAIGTLACAFATSIETLTLLRLFTGIGLGGVLPNAITLSSEYSPARRRLLLVTLSYSGFTLGLALGGWVAGLLLPVLGWKGLMMLGGIAPLLLIPVLMQVLPESTCFMVNSPTHAQRLRSVLTTISGRQDWQGVTLINDTAASVQRSPAVTLFTEGRALRTLMLWLTFFCCLCVFYLLTSWLPTILRDSGYSVADTSLIAAMVPFGGVIGGILMALLMDRVGADKVMPALCLAACAALALTGIQLGNGSMAMSMVMVFLVGFTLTGALVNLSILAATYYPAQARATGVAWALGAGRVGSIIGSMLGAWLFAAAGGLQWLFFWIALPVLLASLALLLMSVRPGQRAASVALGD
ncbi:MFS transporter, AAHS family, 4-hydroxybenzoate transporter [Pseudomonas sp. ok272]|uniref:MFS transporter n=1 Tax=unclassified Pseudomonas TaxID=196821 RepID=UPI0008AC0077|nr:MULTISPECIES: MFS transporter [unclassified Pseudomonas]SEN34468.1 MFS transporter, AAHS family, 4-hydroxybenzoate transporter [Pseudomonas sp. ok272]SFM84303.1 MFS transporter, AAHS family, 4-hydroxybenzoate transporter [Pseudomonas sp. ok602]